jgi:hypothetical protein
MFSCRGQETGGSFWRGGRLALMPSRRSQERSSLTRCVLSVFFFSLPYFEFLDKGAFSWLAVYLVEELILALGTTHLQLVGVVWLVSS